MKKKFPFKTVAIILIIISIFWIESCSTDSSKSMKGIVQTCYKYRDDGSPGREILLQFSGVQLAGKVKIELECEGKIETKELNLSTPVDSLSVLLPEGAGVKSQCDAIVKVINGTNEWKESITVPAFRQWIIMIYPHSHVDIGYTNTHANVELIHTRNLVNGLELARKTKDYPEGARYRWNPEVIWPVERYFSNASEEEKQNILDGIKDGYLPLDAGYVNVNTTIAGDEELLELFRQGQEYKKITGQKIETLVQVDIPGMSWGIVPVAAKLGVKYCFTFNNGSDRVGRSTEHSFIPFWWADSQGKNKILFFQPGSYTPGALAKGKNYWPSMAGQTDPSKLLKIVKTDKPRENFIDAYINEKLPEMEKSDYYPYDIFAMSWAMADNTPIDADLPEAVKSWNEEYAFPKLRIASATEIMRAFDEKYGDQIPVLKGDFTEYWTDGAGTAAKQTAMNRSSKERLVQAETLWTMLNTNKPAPREEFDKAWWNILMGSEHTWCYMNPSQEPLNSDILKTKFAFFNNAQNLSKELLSKALSGIKNEDSSVLAVFNTLSWKRGGIVTISADQAEGFNSVIDEDGDEVKSQRLSTGEIIFSSSEVPAFGSKKYILKKEKAVSAGQLVKENVLDNGMIRVEINSQTGDVSSLKFNKVEFANQNGKCGINSFRYLKGDDAPEKAFAPKNVETSIKDNGPLMATVVVKSQAEGCNILVSEITIFDGQANVDFKNVVDKIAILDKEGIHFGFAFNIENPKVVADIPWGTMEIEKDQLPGANRNWIALQRWLDISNNERGITWCPLDAPVFQVGDITANILGAATNSEKWIRKLEPSGTIYSWALNNHWHTNFQLSQEGKITFRYRLQPHFNGHDYVAANHFGMEQYQPLVAVPVEKSFEGDQLLTLDGSPSVNSTIFKTSKDGKSATLRLRSLSEHDETVLLKWHNRIPVEIYTINLADGNLIEKIKDKVTIPANNFVTLKVNW